MKIKLGLLFIALLSLQCGKTSPQNSDISEYPSEDRDPGAYQQKLRFERGRSINIEEASYLSLNQSRTCTVFPATMHDKTRPYEVMKQLIPGAAETVIMQNQDTNSKDPVQFFFIPRKDLIASNTKVEKETTTWVMRLTVPTEEDSSINDIIIEKSLRPNPNYAGYSEVLANYRAYKIASHFDPHASFVTEYIFCQSNQGPKSGNADIVNYCRIGTEGAVMDSIEGGCYSFDARVSFSARSPKKFPFEVRATAEDPNATVPAPRSSGRVNTDAQADSTPVIEPKSAVEYCKYLSESDKGKWRLPYRQELLWLQEFMPGTKETRAQHFFNFSLYDEADASKPGGEKVPAKFWYFYEANQPGIWAFELTSKEKSWFPRYDHEESVICVHEPEDTDQDGVPNSADLACPNTPYKKEVHRVDTDDGKLRGCAVDGKDTLAPPTSRRG